MRFSLFLSSTLASDLESEDKIPWEQPTYKEILEILRQQNNPEIESNVEYVPWGHPIRNNAADWRLCPELANPAGIFFNLIKYF